MIIKLDFDKILDKNFIFIDIIINLMYFKKYFLLLILYDLILNHKNNLKFIHFLLLNYFLYYRIRNGLRIIPDKILIKSYTLLC